MERGQDQEYNYYTISTGNVVLGVFRYITLTLPQEWIIKKSELASEINYSVEHNGVRWVLEGESHHYLVNLFRGDMYQLNIKCRKITNLNMSVPSGVEDHSTGFTTLAGHGCFFIIGLKKVGLLRKDRMRFVKLMFNCDETKRLIEIEMLGKGPSDLGDLLEVIRNSRCHTD